MCEIATYCHLNVEFLRLREKMRILHSIYEILTSFWTNLDHFNVWNA